MTTPTEPTTEAGRELLIRVKAFVYDSRVRDKAASVKDYTHSIVAIEREAASAEADAWVAESYHRTLDQCPHEARATAPLDVKRLRDCIVKAAAFFDGSLPNLADLAATEYARLTAEGEQK